LCRLRNDLPLARGKGLSYASVRESEVGGYGERKKVADGIWDVKKLYHDGRLLIQLKVGRATFLLRAQARNLRKITRDETERVGPR
jgi:hypothetical protein